MAEITKNLHPARWEAYLEEVKITVAEFTDEPVEELEVWYHYLAGHSIITAADDCLPNPDLG